jgi:hypothetical protein
MIVSACRENPLGNHQNSQKRVWRLGGAPVGANAVRRAPVLALSSSAPRVRDPKLDVPANERANFSVQHKSRRH